MVDLFNNICKARHLIFVTFPNVWKPTICRKGEKLNNNLFSEMVCLNLVT